MVNQQDDLQLPPALRVAANSSRARGRKVDDGLQLPPALRMAANSGLGKKEKKHNERMTLKNDARAMRERLEQMEDKTDYDSPDNSSSNLMNTTTTTSSSTTPVRRTTKPRKSISVNGSVRDDVKAMRQSTKPRRSNSFSSMKDEVAAMRLRLAKAENKTDNTISKGGDSNNLSGSSLSHSSSMPMLDRYAEKKRSASPSKYSDEVLKKKIKKVEKILNQTSPRSKEHRALQKKLIEYRTQLKEESRQSNSNSTTNRTTMNASFAAVDNNDSVIENRAQNTQMREYEQAEKAYKDELRQQARLAVQRNLEKKQREKQAEKEKSTGSKNETKDSKRKDRVPEVRGPSRDIQKDVTEKKIEEASEYNFYTRYGEDEKARKQAFLEEARRLKREALGMKKPKKEPSIKIETKGDDVMMKKIPSYNSVSKEDDTESENSEDIDVSKTKSDDDDEAERRKEAFREEARRLIEKKSKAETLNELSKVKDQNENNEEEQSSTLRKSLNEESKTKQLEEKVASNYAFVDTNDQRRKQAFLEEARRLKQEALKRKAEEEEFQKEAKEKDPKEDKNEKQSFGLRTSAKKDTTKQKSEEREASNYVFDDRSDQIKKQAYLEEARILKQEAMKKKEEEAMRKKQEEDESSDDESTAPVDSKEILDNSALKKQVYLDEARRLKQEAMRKKEEEDESSDDESTAPVESIEILNDSALKKQAYLEEARRMKQEALKRKAEKEESNDDESTIPVESKEILDNSALKKQAYLEEARRLKQEAMRKKEEEAKVQKQEDDESSDDESSDDESIAPAESNEILDNSALKKQAYLDEARRLKQEAMRKKASETEYSNERMKEAEEECSDDESLAATESEEIEEDNTLKKDSYLEEARRLKQEAIRNKALDREVEKQKTAESQGSDDVIKNKPETVESTEIENEKDENNDEKEESGSTLFPDSSIQVEDQISDSSDVATELPTRKKRPSFLQSIKSRIQGKKGNAQKKDEDPTLDSTHLLDKIKPKGESEHEESRQNPSTLPSGKKPSFLEDIKSKSEAKKEDTHQNTSIPASRKKPSFLEEMKARSEAKNEDTHQHASIPVSRKKPSFLEEMKARSEAKNEDTHQHASIPVSRKKPSFLEEMKARSEAKKEDTHQNASITASRKKPSFLEEMKARSEAKNDDTHRNASIPVSRKKPSFLEEMKATAESKLNTDKNSQNNSNEMNSRVEESSRAVGLQQSERFNSTRIENTQTLTKEEIEGSPAKEVSKDYLDRRTLVEPLSNNTKKILRELEDNEIRQKKLEKSLTQNGIQVSDDISYGEAKDKIAQISDSMRALASTAMDYTAEKEYFRLEEQLSKYTTALMLTDEYVEELRCLEQDWEDSIEADNIAALRKLRSHMPVKIRHLTEEELVTTPSPNGKTLPKAIARKFKRTDVLQLLRVDPDDIEKMHPSLLESKRTTGLTLTERRALHQHFRGVVERWSEKKADPSVEKKYQWYENLKLKFKETLTAYMRCVEQFGPPGSHHYAKRSDPNGGGCRLIGNQCPIKADATVSYDDDHGYTQEAQYENSSNRSEPKKASESNTPTLKRMSSKVATKSEVEIMQDHRDRLQLDDNETEVDKKLLRELVHSDKRTKSLEKQLTHAGLSLPKVDISYGVAKTRIAELTKELNVIAVSMGNTGDSKEQAKLEFAFGKLSEELDKYNNALMLTKEWAQEQKDKERQWELDISVDNYESLKKVRRHLPVNIRNLSENSLATELTPNGKVLPKALARKFKRTNILMILRTEPSAIEVMHPSSLESMRTTGLTLTERRAIHEHLKGVAPKWKAMVSDKMCERKWMWHASLQSKLKEMIGNERYEKADLATDYSGDYGYPEEAEYEQQAVAKSNLMTMEELEKRRMEDEYR